MKKIMFNDRYGLTEAVLEKRKTMTRRIIPSIEINWVRHGKVTLPVSGYRHRALWMDCRQFLPDSSPFDYVAPQKYQPAYDFDEEVAVAQKYSFLYNHMLFYTGKENSCIQVKVGKRTELQAGWTNKMFVRADLMPHRIRITNIRVERLQDISDEDCIREGIEVEDFRGDYRWGFYTGFFTTNRGQGCKSVWCNSPQKAFAALIDRISGKGTWERNPWVFVYEFELVK